VALQAPIVVLSPLAGVLADKWNRRTAMIVSDFGAGLAVFATAALFLTGHLQPWMVIPLNFLMSSFNTLMWPSYTASVTLLVPKEQYGRVNGFVQLGEALPQIAGPAIAGALYVAVKLGNMALIDGATYLFSVTLMLLLVRIPNPPRTEEGQRSASGSVWEQMRFGWDYIIERKGLLVLLLFYLSMNFIDGIISALFVPLVLDNWSADVLGYLSTLMGGGMLTGTLVMSAWVTSLAHIGMNNFAASFSYFAVVPYRILANVGLALTMIIVVAVISFMKELDVFQEYFQDNNAGWRGRLGHGLRVPLHLTGEK
jgi:MFS family permease